MCIYHTQQNTENIILEMSLTRVSETSMPYCRNCGHEVNQDSKFCPQCGASVTSVALKQSSATTPIVPIMLFVLGLFLMAAGVIVELPTETYQAWVGLPNRQWETATVHPYEAQAALLIFIGIIAVVAAFILARTKRKLF